MCLNPISIRNPKYLKKSYASEKGSLVELPSHITPTSEYIKVNCGQCAECKTARYNAILQRALVESMSAYMFFITLTYNNDHIPSIKFPDGQQIFFADYDHIQEMFKRLRNTGVLDRDFRYLCVNEYGDQTSRPHFHIILFVARKDNDSLSTPQTIQSILFNTIKRIWAVNIGTRKNPVYEPLFTYQIKQTKKGVKTNYFVKYVEPTQPLTQMQEFLIPDLTTVKTTKYLIGYVQKPSNFESRVAMYLKRYDNDPIMSLKLKNLLKSQVRYSKGFGCGFTNGKKHYLPRISVRASSNTILYTELCDSLPNTYVEFEELYPDQAENLQHFIKADIYRKYRRTSWRKCIASFSVDEYFNHCLYLKYFKKEFTQRYRQYFRRKENVNHTVSFYYNYAHRNTYYDMTKVRTVAPTSSKVFTFLRKGVEEGIAAGIPYLAFKMIGQQKYTALCKFYRDRVCTIEDTLRIFKRLNLNSYDEWIALFQQQKSLRKSNLLQGNQAKYYSEDKKIIQSTCKSQKNYLSLQQSYEGETLYTYLLSDCKFTNCKHQNPTQKGV